MIKKRILVILMLLLTMLFLLVACNSSLTSSESFENNEDFPQDIPELISNRGDESEIRCAIEVIVNRYLTKDPDIEIGTKDIDLSVIFEISTEVQALLPCMIIMVISNIWEWIFLVKWAKYRTHILSRNILSSTRL